MCEQHPPDGAQIKALVGVSQVTCVAREMWKRFRITPFVALLQHDDIIAPIVSLCLERSSVSEKAVASGEKAK